MMQNLSQVTNVQPQGSMSPLLLLIVLVILLLGVWMILRGLGKNRKKAEGGEASCGHCGYIVLGLERLICPECGNDLREVGIEKPRANDGKGLIVKGSILMGIVFLLVVLLWFTVA
ncbi:hypothetical protein JD969_06130 [Planctomycetota bacterium]|nr:hypothetical protein JD969_06130 [Planctomycetota bacterium]